MAQLVFLKDGSEAVCFPLPLGEISLGRDPGCTITLEGPQVSRCHSRIRYQGGFFEIEDSSKNGTTINDQRITKARLKDKDLIAIGDWRLRFIEDKKGASPETVTVTSQGLAADLAEGVGGMVGQSPRMKELFSLIRRMADNPATALILGETGTGKELIANALHTVSKRVRLPFVALNCAAISPQLVESEIFGHERGAFTGATDQHPGAFEQAGGGTLFLDEIGELSLDLQSKFLRTLEVQKIRRVGGKEEIPIRCRLVAATHRNLMEEVKRGKFREDLYYRLFVMPIEIPPLRQRREDIPSLVDHFLKEMRPGSPLRISKGAVKKLGEHLWPGNVRELKNVILRAALLAGEEEIQESHTVFLPHAFAENAQEPRTIAEMEKGMILEKLKQTNWNKAAAARELGLATSTIFKKIKEYDLNP